MLPTRVVPGQSGVMRKRLEGKQSMLPKPRRPGSVDRRSTEAGRSSMTQRSSSAEPPRSTLFASRPSREMSATKSYLNKRSKSQQQESRYPSSITPLRSTHYLKAPTTPLGKSPSDERLAPSWQSCLDRALAFVTVRDQRPISDASWQRSELIRVQAALCARAGEGGAASLMRPLTIARFVEIAGLLLGAIIRDVRLNKDNYITKLPHLSKRLLYPGAVSKSWLKTVNTLHAFPHAVALLGYLLDLATLIETPVCEDTLYADKDQVTQLRREYMYKSYLRFQNCDNFESLQEEYLVKLKELMGDDEKKITNLKEIIKKYEQTLEDEDCEEAGVRAEEAALVERRDALLGALRGERAARAAITASIVAARADRAANVDTLRALDAEIERASAENAALRRELEEQPMTVEERANLLDEVDYNNRVLNSKHSLVEKISKSLMEKENDLARWQTATLESCKEYKQLLIHLNVHCPELASLDIDEKELMDPECLPRVTAAVETLRAHCTALNERRAELLRQRSALSRKRAGLVEEYRTKISELKSSVERNKRALESDIAKEASEASAWASEELELTKRLEELKRNQEEYTKINNELEFWEKQDTAWRAKLAELREYVEEQQETRKRLLEEVTQRAVNDVLTFVNTCHQHLDK